MNSGAQQRPNTTIPYFGSKNNWRRLDAPTQLEGEYYKACELLLEVNRANSFAGCHEAFWVVVLPCNLQEFVRISGSCLEIGPRYMFFDKPTKLRRETFRHCPQSHASTAYI